MKMRWIFLVLGVLLLASACSIKQPEIPKDTPIVNLKADEFSEENSILKEKISLLEKKIQDLETELVNVKEERDKYLQELDDFYLTEITGTMDLINWDDSDIVTALGNYNEKFKSASWKTYSYRRDKKDFYWDVGGDFFEDPFFELRRKDQDHELNVFHFRIERFALKGNRSLAEEKYKDYLDDLLKETQIDPDLTCFQQTGCRNIRIIKCVKDDKDYYSWFEGTHLFVSRFDGREALDAFEKLYCHPGRI